MSVGGVVLRERFGLDNLGGVRGRVRQASLDAGLRPDLADNLTTATAEGMTNAIMYGGSVRRVTIWVVADVGVVAEVYDDGRADAFGPPAHARQRTTRAAAGCCWCTRCATASASPPDVTARY